MGGQNALYLSKTNNKKGVVEIKKKLSILIVEDSLLIVKRLRLLLNDFDCVDEIYQANNADEALLISSQLKPNVIFLDIKIPGRSGVEVLPDLLKQNFSIVIVLSNYSDESYRKLCMDRGANYFLDKSNEFDKIKEILNTIYSKEYAPN